MYRNIISSSLPLFLWILKHLAVDPKINRFNPISSVYWGITTSLHISTHIIKIQLNPKQSKHITHFPSRMSTKDINMSEQNESYKKAKTTNSSTPSNSISKDEDISFRNRLYAPLKHKNSTKPNKKPHTDPSNSPLTYTRKIVNVPDGAPLAEIIYDIEKDFNAKIIVDRSRISHHNEQNFVYLAFSTKQAFEASITYDGIWGKADPHPLPLISEEIENFYRLFLSIIGGKSFTAEQAKQIITKKVFLNNDKAVVSVKVNCENKWVTVYVANAVHYETILKYGTIDEDSIGRLVVVKHMCDSNDPNLLKIFVSNLEAHLLDKDLEAWLFKLRIPFVFASVRRNTDGISVRNATILVKGGKNAQKLLAMNGKNLGGVSALKIQPFIKKKQEEDSDSN
jgi:hypothetical protein